jgi:hypothetical protein
VRVNTQPPPSAGGRAEGGNCMEHLGGVHHHPTTNGGCLTNTEQFASPMASLDPASRGPLGKVVESIVSLNYKAHAASVVEAATERYRFRFLFSHPGGARDHYARVLVWLRTHRREALELAADHLLRQQIAASIRRGLRRSRKQHFGRQQQGGRR